MLGAPEIPSISMIFTLQIREIPKVILVVFQPEMMLQDHTMSCLPPCLVLLLIRAAPGFTCRVKDGRFAKVGKLAALHYTKQNSALCSST